MINPFNPHYPAEARFFANRKREQDWLRNAFLPSLHPEGAGPWNTAILGPWGIGKSSLVRRLREMAPESPVPTGAVFVSCTTGFGSLLGFARALVANVRNEILSLCGWSESVRTELERWSVQIAVPGISMKRERRDEAGDSANAAEYLHSSLRRYWEKILAPAEKSLVLILDDANLLQDIDSQALMILRAVFQDLQMYRTRYGLVITGLPALFGKVRETAEPVTRFFEHIPLGAFDLEDTADAVRQPLGEAGAPFQVADDAVAWVNKQGLPVIDTAVCCKCWPRIAGHLETDKFNAEWVSATPAEQEVLLAFAHGKERQGNKRALFSRLMQKNLLMRTSRGQYELYHPLFAAFLRGRQCN
ncbi:MAG TPA: ATP-binding protein [Spirochaetia bacterium]|nr:ATP-binding protein [Spirochaetia bacterium]